MTFYAMLVYLALACVGIVALEVLGLPLDGSITNDFLVRTWVEPGWTDLGLLALAGLAAVIGMFCLSQAYRMAAVATVAPFEFTALIWAGDSATCSGRSAGRPQRAWRSAHRRGRHLRDETGSGTRGETLREVLDRGM